MDAQLPPFFADLIARVHGPLSFRFVLQPAMAMIYAIRDGVADAQEGRPPYFWTMFTRANQRRDLLREGWKAVVRVITLGVVMDVIFQLMVFHTIYPLQLVVIVLGLAFVPYLMLRGPVERIVTVWRTRHIHTQARTAERKPHP
jgi:hypothetical protein